MKAAAAERLCVASVIASLTGPTIERIGAKEKPALRQSGTQFESGDNKLKSFAKSCIEFHRSRAENEPAFNRARDSHEPGKNEQEAQAMFDKAVQKQGLSHEGFFRLFQPANANEQIREKALRVVD